MALPYVTNEQLQKEIKKEVSKLSPSGEGTKVVANPELEGNEASLTGLDIDGTKYKVEQPIDVVANPELAGTETSLSSIKIGEDKYKIVNEFAGDIIANYGTIASANIPEKNGLYRILVNDVVSGIISIYHVSPTKIIYSGIYNDRVFANGEGLSTSNQISLTNQLKNVVANPTLAGTEADLTGLEIAGTKYKMPTELPTITGSDTGKVLKVNVSGNPEWSADVGTVVVANPTLDGTETALTGLEVAGTKYQLPIELPSVTTSDEGKVLQVNSSGAWVAQTLPSGVEYLTTAPSAANTNGNLIPVVLTSEPATKYDGYIYFITEA